MIRVRWLEPLKALALLGVLCNHFVEVFGPGPWFTNPSNDWPSLPDRLRRIYPADPNPFTALFNFVGWLGDSAPGVFILASGLGLTLGALKAGETMDVTRFYARRVLRLFPLYIAAHFLVLGCALYFFGAEAQGFSDRRTLFSLLGLRFYPWLFFSISPSWWFVWLILQMYLAFPFLYRALVRLGPLRFFAGCLAITVASRLYGILFSHHLYAWMTGQFMGTRLAEFAAGMALAVWLVEKRTSPDQTGFPSLRMLAGSALVYAAGFACSLTLTGSLISNLLVTLGLTGLGCWACSQPRLAGSHIEAALRWLGLNSYAVYLIHQPFLIWTDRLFPGNSPAHRVAAIGVLILSFPAGALLSRAVEGFVSRILMRRSLPGSPFLVPLCALSICLVLAGIEPGLLVSGRAYRAMSLILGLAWVFLLAGEFVANADTENTAARLLRRTALLAVPLQFWFLPANLGLMSVLFSAFAALPLEAIVRTSSSIRINWNRKGYLPLVLGIILLMGVEFFLSRFIPMAKSTRTLGGIPGPDPGFSDKDPLLSRENPD